MSSQDPLAGYSPDWRTKQLPIGGVTPDDDPLAGYTPDWRSQPAESGIDLSGLARTFGQGVTLGFGDELEGLVRGAAALVPGGMSPREAYGAGVQGARQDVEQFREEHPVLATTAEIGGAVLPSLLPIPGAQAGLARAATTALRSPLGRGAIEGAVAGAGATEGGIPERLKGAAFGAGGGAVGGKLAGAVGKRLPQPRRIAAGQALEEVAQREGSGLRGIAGRMQPGQMVPEVGEPGGPLQALTRKVTGTQEPGARQLRQTIQERARRVPGEVSEAIEQHTGLTADDALRTADELAAARRTNAAPLYEQAFARGAIDDPGIQKLIQEKPSLQSAYQRAQQTAAEEGVGLAPLESPDVRTLHMMKEELDDLIRRAGRSAEASAPSARQTRAMLQTKNELLRRLEDAVPEYKAARLQYAGDAAVEESFEAAREGSQRLGLKPFLREDPRRIERALAEMTPSEQELYRRGAVDAVLNLPADRRSRLVLGEDPQVQNRIRQLFQNDADFEQFTQSLAEPRARQQLGRLAGRAGQAPTGSLAGPGVRERVAEFAGGLAQSPIAPLRGRARMASALSGNKGLTAGATSELGRLLAEATPEDLRRLDLLLSSARTAVPGAIGTEAGLGLGRRQNR